MTACQKNLTSIPQALITSNLLVHTDYNNIIIFTSFSAQCRETRRGYNCLYPKKHGTEKHNWFSFLIVADASMEIYKKRSWTRDIVTIMQCYMSVLFPALPLILFDWTTDVQFDHWLCNLIKYVGLHCKITCLVA